MEVEKNVENKLSAEQVAEMDQKLATYKASFTSNYNEALEGILSLEKTSRTVGDDKYTAHIATQLLQLDFDNQMLSELCTHITLISKRRAQLKNVISEMTKTGLGFVPQIKDEEKKVNLLQTLKALTEGKIYVERERATIAKMLAKIYKARGDISASAKYIQEIQVETFGSMNKEEKTAFLLKQVRLCLDSNDFVKAFIISNKVNRSVFNEEKMNVLKVKFYRLMIRYYLHSHNYLEICRCYMQLAETKTEGTQWIFYFGAAIAYVLLTPYSQIQDDLANRLNISRNLEVETQLAPFKCLLSEYLNTELISWSSFTERYLSGLCSVFAYVPPTSEPTDVLIEKCKSDLHGRIVEHNIRMIAKYYTKITLLRLSELLELRNERNESDMKKAEEYLSKLVTQQDVTAKIDRVEGIVSFVVKENTIDVWTEQTAKVYTAVDETAHIVQREMIAYSIQE